MTTITLISRSLRFYWRTHLGVLLAVAVAAAVLSGALAVGDSVRQSLRQTALQRLGNFEYAMPTGDRFFRADLLGGDSRGTAAVVQLTGLAMVPTEAGESEDEDAAVEATAEQPSAAGARANDVQILGVDPSFWRLGTGQAATLARGEAAINERLARQLGVQVGDQIALRVERPSLLPRDAPLSSDEEKVSYFTSRRLTVVRVVPDGQLGRFGLAPQQVPPYNLFVDRDWLAEKIGQAGRANLLLATGGGQPAGALQEAVEAAFDLSDGGLIVRRVAPDTVELSTKRVFLEPAVVAAATAAQSDPTGVLAYFVNTIRSGKAQTPYSMVAAMGRIDPAGNAIAPPGQATAVDPGKMLITQWEADDLSEQAGAAATQPAAEITLDYLTLGPMRKLLTHSTSFRLARTIPMTGAATDQTLMPDYPGLSDSADCRKWHPGIPIDTGRIRKGKDDTYWDEHRGSPKAFISLVDAQRIWGNRFGNLTALRWKTADSPEQVAGRIRGKLDAKRLGFVVQPVREQALAAADPATDFGQLFLGFSFFLVIAALLLMGLLFAFGLQQRAGQVGTMLAIGFTPAQVRRVMLAEAMVLAVVGSALGCGLGLLYTKAMLGGLAGVWQQAVASASVQFAVEPGTLAVGFAAAIVVCGLVIYLVLRRQARAPVRALLSGESDRRGDAETRRGKRGEGRGERGETTRRGIIPLAMAALLLVAAVAVSVVYGHGDSAAGAFFGAGAAVLAAGLLALAGVLRREPAAKAHSMSLVGLALRNARRRTTRSLATAGLLACGCFIVVAVGANRHDPAQDASDKAGGTGGFALLGKSSLPLFRDLNTVEGRKDLGLAKTDLHDVGVVSLRLREAAEASCLNLNKPAIAQLLGANSADLTGRFTFKESRGGVPADWTCLDADLDGGAVPAVGDENTIRWALGRKLGDELTYTGDNGSEVRVRLVGMLDNNILQGSLIISQRQMERHFATSGAGWRVFLIDCPAARVADVSSSLASRLTDYGLEVTPAARRLAELSAVENTYLSIFQLLGGLGLILGSGGLGLVVMRNVLERRGELALMRAVGFTRGRLQVVVAVEHAMLLVAGLLIGVIAAALAVWPAVRSSGAAIPFGSLAVTLLAVVVVGLVATVGATAWSLRGNLLAALRNE